MSFLRGIKEMNKYIYLIPARAGSKRIPNKNILELDAKPLLVHSIDFAKNFVSYENIFVLTDSLKASEISNKENVIGVCVAALFTCVFDNDRNDMVCVFLCVMSFFSLCVLFW